MSHHIIHRCAWGTLLLAAAVAGCDRPAGEAGGLHLTPSAVRAGRRLYDGAPPVIPHPPLQIKCTACHTDTGKEAPPLGFAPANPHARTDGLAGTSFCQQCHVFRRSEAALVDNDFAGLPQRLVKSDRLYPGAPPVIPHRVLMRENCTACHSGPAARLEIRCTHPERAHCRQCHVPVVEPNATPDVTDIPVAAMR